MVKDHSDNERKMLSSLHRLLFPNSSKASFISTASDRIVRTTAYVKPVVKHWVEQNT